ncbi:MAG: C1 family peptidase [Pseudomonadota bacterium]
MNASVFELGTGWVPETHSKQDLHHAHEHVTPHLERLGVHAASRLGHRLPAKADLRRWATPVRFQGGYNTCSAHVVAALLGYFEKRAEGRYVAPSRLFLYKAAKNFLRESGDNGTYIRQVMGVLRALGAPPEKYWPYLKAGTMKAPRRDDPRIDAEPTAFCYAIAGDYKAVNYYRLDRPDQPDPEALLQRARAHLAAGLPFAFGFPLLPSLALSVRSGRLLPPKDGEQPIGNHAVVAMGYSDRVVIGDPAKGYPKTRGAFLIQNSWSRDWGEQGFGWLPYAFVREGLCADFWTLVKAEWVDLGRSQLGV